LLSKFNLTWVFLDGVIVITSEDESREIMLTAVYDVRDLCRDEGESMALENAIYSQTQSGWQLEGNGNGNIAFANPGTMVVRHTERVHTDLLNLLENYRLALKASKPRNRSEVDPKEVLTLYYRVPTLITADLEKLLPQMVKPDSWKSEDRQDAVGTITILASRPDVLEGRGIVGKSGDNAKSSSAQNVLYLENSVMIIKQSRENHELIAQTIRKVEYGDQLMSPTGMGGMGGGMGGMGGAGMGGMGFGGGFFSVPLRPQ
ncbi:MAG: hypothetical protein ACKVT0_11605, partial [Planctomycetaceae bacterium]